MSDTRRVSRCAVPCGTALPSATPGSRSRSGCSATSCRNAMAASAAWSIWSRSSARRSRALRRSSSSRTAVGCTHARSANSAIAGPRHSANASSRGPRLVGGGCRWHRQAASRSTRHRVRRPRHRAGNPDRRPRPERRWGGSGVAARPVTGVQQRGVRAGRAPIGDRRVVRPRRSCSGGAGARTSRSRWRRLAIGTSTPSTTT